LSEGFDVGTWASVIGALAALGFGYFAL